MAKVEEEVTLLGLINVLLRRWRMIVVAPIVVAAVVALGSFAIRPTYTATTVFLAETPTQRALPGGIAGLAGQLGFSLGVNAGQSPRFYAEVLKSRNLMTKVLTARYPDPRSPADPPSEVSLLQILEVKGKDLGDSVDAGLKTLNGLISTSVDNLTSVVSLSVQTHYPALSAAVANQFISELNEFNTKSRQSQAHERRQFVEGRLVDAEDRLRRAEAALRDFYQRNRTWQQSPQFVFEEGSLRRQVDIRQEVYLTLQREYETSRIEEVNQTPVITVIDVAVPPRKKSKPRRDVLVMLGLLAGAVVGAFWTFGAEYLQRMQQHEAEDYREFQRIVKPASRP